MSCCRVVVFIRALTHGVRKACGGRYVHPPHAGNSGGFATAELAVNLISLTGVFVFLIAGVSWGHAQFVVTDAARSAARMIARGETSAAIESAIAHRYPQVRIIFEQRDDLVTANAFITPWVPAFVSLEHVPAIGASATADVEGWGAPPWR